MSLLSAGNARGPLARASIITIALIALIALLPPAAGAREVLQPAEEVLGYWTPERIANAKPGELIGAGLAPSRAEAAADGSRFAVGDPSAPGNRTHGKVYLTIPGEGDFVCSGTAVRSFSHSLVTTAGHCVSEGRTFAENWMFVPAYDRGSEPFGRWTAHELGATAGWRSSTDLRFDVGMALVRELDGKPLEEVVGARQIAFNQPRDKLYTAYGYPASSPPFEFTGEREFACTSSWRGDDPTFSAPRPMRIACDMTPGSSGGSWVSNGTVLSVNSFKAGIILPDSRFMFGPYFGDAVKDLYREMGGGPVLCKPAKARLAAATRRLADARESGAGRRAIRRAKRARRAARERYRACRSGEFS